MIGHGDRGAVLPGRAISIVFPHASDWENAPAVSASADSAAACRLTAGFTRSAARTAPPQQAGAHPQHEPVAAKRQGCKPEP